MSLVGRCALPWWLKRNDCFAFQIPFAHSALLRREHGLLIEKRTQKHVITLFRKVFISFNKGKSFWGKEFGAFWYFSTFSLTLSFHPPKTLSTSVKTAAERFIAVKTFQSFDLTVIHFSCAANSYANARKDKILVTINFDHACIWGTAIRACPQVELTLLIFKESQYQHRLMYKRKLLLNSFPFNSYTSIGWDSQTQDPSNEHEQNHKMKFSLFFVNRWRSASTNLAKLFNIRTK